LLLHSRVHFRFGLFFIKKSNQTDFFYKKIKTGSNRPVSVRFGFLEQKLVQTGLTWFFRFGFGSVFSYTPTYQLTRNYSYVAISMGILTYFNCIYILTTFFFGGWKEYILIVKIYKEIHYVGGTTPNIIWKTNPFLIPWNQTPWLVIILEWKSIAFHLEKQLLW